MAVVNTNIGASVAQAALTRNERALNLLPPPEGKLSGTMLQVLQSAHDLANQRA